MFPNAFKGISKILTAQWLKFLFVILMIVGVIIILVSAYNGNTSGLSAVSTVGLVVFIIAAIVGIVALVLELIGVTLARKDEKNFNYAFFFCIISLVAMIASVSLQAVNKEIATWLGFAQTMCTLAVIECVVSGIIAIAEELNKTDIAESGAKLRVLITAVFIVVIGVQLFSIVTNVGDIVIAAYYLLELGAYIAYIVLLTRAKKMLYR